jgi:hypothetical protein
MGIGPLGIYRELFASFWSMDMSCGNSRSDLDASREPNNWIIMVIKYLPLYQIKKIEILMT